MKVRFAADMLNSSRSRDAHACLIEQIAVSSVY